MVICWGDSMKRKWIIYLLLLLSVVLVGCSSKNKSAESFEISLYDNSSTGYYWSYDIDNKGIVDIAESSDYSKCPSDVDGCGGEKIYKVKALKSGKVRLSLEYKSSAHSDYETKTAVYDITVNKDLSITESHFGTYFEE